MDPIYLLTIILMLVAGLKQTLELNISHLGVYLRERLVVNLVRNSK